MKLVLKWWCLFINKDARALLCALDISRIYKTGFKRSADCQPDTKSQQKLHRSMGAISEEFKHSAGGALSEAIVAAALSILK